MPPMTLNKLVDVKIRHLKPADKVKRYADGGGLYLEISPQGTKLWRMKYRFENREKRLAFGIYPEVGLTDARAKRDAAKKLLAEGIDPGKAKKLQKRQSATNLFCDVAEEYVANQQEVWSANHTRTVKGRLKLDVYPAFGQEDITSITPQDIFAMLRKIESRRAFETASRVLGICSLVFKYAVTIGAAPYNPCQDLRPALKPFIKGQFAAITKPKEVGALMRSIDDYKGSAVVRAALQFSALTFCRPGEVRAATWTEVDLEERMWTIPPERMKGRVEHKVPLARQAMSVLTELYQLTGRGKYVFPTPRTIDRHLSENAVLVALRTMGYDKETMTAHGFRSMASTLLNELSHRPDVIEAQLAHKGADRIRAIYNRAEYLQERRNLMQAYADLLDKLRDA